MTSRWVTGSAIIFVLAARATAVADPTPAAYQRKTIEPEAGTEGYRALLYLPASYTGRDRWPVILYLHGAIERGSNIESAAKTGPPKEIEAGKALPFIVVAPLLPRDGTWSPALLASLLDTVAATERVDPERIYVTGKSLGGRGAWELAVAFPGRFAAIVPVSAPGKMDPCGIGRLPVWAFHNEEDPVAPFHQAEETVDAVKKCGGRAMLTGYPQANGHDAWTATYADGKLYDWLLQHERSAQPPARSPTLDSGAGPS